MLRKRELEEQMRRQREESYRMGNFMDVSSTERRAEFKERVLVPFVY